jgi:hypothetical protein
MKVIHIKLNAVRMNHYAQKHFDYFTLNFLKIFIFKFVLYYFNLF